MFASSSRVAPSASASATSSGTRAMLPRCKTTFSVRGSPSARTAAAVAFFASSSARPAIQAAPCGSTSCTDSCKLSSPAAASRASRSASAGMPLVIRLTYSSRLRAAATSASRSRRTSGSPPVRLTCRTPSAAASANTRSQSAVSSSVSVAADRSSGFEQYAQPSGQR